MLPRQHLDHLHVDVATKNAIDVSAHRVVVEGEMRHAQQTVHFDELDQLLSSVELVVQWFHAHSYLVLPSNYIPITFIVNVCHRLQLQYSTSTVISVLGQLAECLLAEGFFAEALSPNGHVAE